MVHSRDSENAPEGHLRGRICGWAEEFVRFLTCFSLKKEVGKEGMLLLVCGGVGGLF